MSELTFGIFCCTITYLALFALIQILGIVGWFNAVFVVFELYFLVCNVYNCIALYNYKR